MIQRERANQTHRDNPLGKSDVAVNGQDPSIAFPFKNTPYAFIRVMYM